MQPSDDPGIEAAEYRVRVIRNTRRLVIGCVVLGLIALLVAALHDPFSLNNLLIAIGWWVIGAACWYEGRRSVRASYRQLPD